MAAGYAAVLGVVGALLGSLAGGLIGVAVAHPLTQYGAPVTSLLPAYFDVPWLLVLLLVVGVPALAAAVAALTARGTPPGPQRRALA